MINKITEAVIYESLDGGKTIYVRQPGQVQRELYIESQEAKELRELIEQKELWTEILRASKNNSTLKSMLDQVVMLYELTK